MSWSSVNSRGVVVVLLYRGERACQNENLERHYYPYGVEAQHEHLRPVRTVNEVNGRAAEEVYEQVHKSVAVRSLFKENHEHKTDRKGVRHVRQKIDSLKEISERLYRRESGGNEKRDYRRERHGDYNKYKCVFQRGEEVRVVENVGIVVPADAEICL